MICKCIRFTNHAWGDFFLTPIFSKISMLDDYWSRKWRIFVVWSWYTHQIKTLVFLSSFYLSNRSWYMFIRPYLDSKLTQIWENISFWSQNWWKFRYRNNSKNQHFQKKRDKRCEIRSNTCSFDHIWQKKLLNHRHIGKKTKKKSK